MFSYKKSSIALLTTASLLLGQSASAYWYFNADNGYLNNDQNTSFAGNVAIGFSTASYRLDVAWSTRSDQFFSYNNGNGTNYQVGDDAWIGDVNMGNTIGIKGISNSSLGYIKFGSDGNLFGYNGSTLTYGGNAFAIKNSSWNPRGTNLWGAFNLNGGDASFSETSGQMTLSLDGTVYVDEGRYPVINSGNIGSQSVNYANSANYSSTTTSTIGFGTSGNWNTDFQNTGAHSTRWTELNAGTNGPSTGWWFQENMRHSNGSNYWGRQFAYGWEDKANQIWTRNISANNFGSWYQIPVADGGTYWLSITGNAGYAGSAGNADTVDGYHVGSLLKWNTWDNGNYYGTDGNIYMAWAGQWISNAMHRKDVAQELWNNNRFGSNKGASSYAGGQSDYGLQAFSADGGAAGMSFHRGGYYAVNMGLDPDNVLRIGGWSAGANRWQLDMSGNETLAGSSYAQSFRDTNDGNYYMDPNGTSRMNAINANSLRSYGNVYTDGNFGYGLVGVYDSYRYQGIFSMGSSWALAADGTNPGNLYGLAWTHSNVGGQSKAGLGHQMLVMENGVTQTAIGNGIWTRANISAAWVMYAGAYYYSSDARLKHDINSISTDSALETIRKLNPVTFKWNKDESGDIGFIAQEVEKIYPDLVNTNEQTGMKAVKYGNLVAPAIAGIKALDEKQASLEAQVATLQAENIELRSRLEDIERLLTK